jgi:DNA-binding response OmpR family regulator
MRQPNTGGKHRNPARILVAEDDPDLRSAMSIELTQAGFDVIEAEDGSSLLDYLAGSLDVDGTLDQYDVIVCDIQMPGYTALDVLAAAQRQALRTPILIVTGMTDPHVRERALQLGAADVLLKPVPLDELRLNVCRLLTRSMPGVSRTPS